MKNYFLFIAAIQLAACTSNHQGEKEKFIAKIDSLEKKMFSSQSMEQDKNLIAQGISAYQEFTEKYSDDSLHCAEYLFRCSELLNNIGEHRKAIDVLNSICKKYPSYKKIPECLFLQGYYEHEFLKDTVRAKEFYEQLLSKYPNHAFADDAKALMKMFGKTDEEIIKEFEKKNDTPHP